MENNGWSLFTQNGNRPMDAWDMWALSCSSMGVGSDPDPLVVSLNLNVGGGKNGRRSLEEAAASAAAHQGGGVVKRSKSGGGGGEPRCQVEGCDVGLENAKGYHRKHKVCEMHSKAPKVLLLGHEQRFCQQCSRFHAVSEFDETKRSCRRRLAGHNERRRKISQHSSTTTKSSCHGFQSYRAWADCVETDYKLKMGDRRCENNKSAHSLLSTNNDYFLVSNDLPARCNNGAFNDLMGESKAAIFGNRQSIVPSTHYDSVVNKHPSLGDFHFT